MKKFLIVLLALALVIGLAACGDKGGNEGEKPPVTDEKPPVTDDTPIPPPKDEYHIGMVTLTMSQGEDEFRGVEKMVEKYGRVEDGGLIKWVVLPDSFADEQELVISLIAGLADDPLMKAVIVNQGVQGTAAGFQKIKEAGRDDVTLLVNMPQDDPEVMRNVATYIADTDNVLRGYYDIVRAKNMGATKFVHLSFPRHMGVYVLARRRAIYEEACKDLGIEFVFETVPDPAAGDLGVAGAQQQVYEMMPRLVEKHGKDAVYFTTNTGLHEPIIKRVVELGAMFVNSDDVTPLTGFPTALNLDLTKEAGDWMAIVHKIEETVVDAGESGRVGCWPYSEPYAASIALIEFAKEIIDGTGTGDIKNDLVTKFQAVTPGCDWLTDVFVYPDASKISNYFLLAMDTYIFGEGYSGVMTTPVPEKYFFLDFDLENQ
ncbi:MAG: DUF3798 domain-containing protein [Clostridiales bacterium]|jgi:predicted small lipoprotein YifL|nr:DUF3798 domain-containing protein [Clostridiales bacterium]